MNRLHRRSAASVSRAAASLAAAQPAGCILGAARGLRGDAAVQEQRLSLRSGPGTKGQRGLGFQAWGGARQDDRGEDVLTSVSCGGLGRSARCPGRRAGRGEGQVRTAGQRGGGWEGLEIMGLGGGGQVPAPGRVYDMG